MELGQHTELSLPEIQVLKFSFHGIELRVLPVVHNSILFAQAAHKALPGVDRVFIEFPRELRSEFLAAVKRLPLPTMIHRSLPRTVQISNDNTAYFVHPGDASYWTAHRCSELEIPFELIDSYTRQRGTDVLPFEPGTYSFLGWQSFFEHWDGGGHIGSVHATRSCMMARTIVQEIAEGGKYMVVVGIAHVPFLVRLLEQEYGVSLLSMHPGLSREVDLTLERTGSIEERIEEGEWILSDIHPHSLYLVMEDFPYLVTEFVLHREQFSYLGSLRNLFFDAHREYRDKFGDTISPATFQRMFQYLRNLTRLGRRLTPSMLDVLLAASGMSDGDYSFEVYRRMVTYGFLPTVGDRLETEVKVIPDEVTKRSIRFVFKRRLPRPILKKIPRDDPWEDLDPIPEEDYPGHWQDIWNRYSQFGQVSYPPEDVYFENYLNMLRRKAQEILSEEKVVVEEFRTSLEDGIDWNETVRKWYDKKIYVRRVPKVKPRIGALVVQFLPEQSEEFTHHTILYAEHEKESDIAIVGTEPGDMLVGPGIARMKLAGVVSVFPPQGYGVRVPMTRDDFTTRLLYTAINMAIDEVIVLVSPVRPTTAHRYFVSSFGFRLLYLPMQQLTKTSLHRLRTMHILAHRGLRDIAKHYIGF